MCYDSQKIYMDQLLASLVKPSFRKHGKIQKIADLWGISDHWLNVAEDGCICTGVGHSGATMQ